MSLSSAAVEVYTEYCPMLPQKKSQESSSQICSYNTLPQNLKGETLHNTLFGIQCLLLEWIMSCMISSYLEIGLYHKYLFFGCSIVLSFTLLIKYIETQMNVLCCRQWKADCLENKRSVAKLRNSAENCKHILSTMPTAQSSVDSLFEGIDFQCNLSR